jgi:phosphate uptake regulator
MEQRKLIKLGNSSFAIALPKDWVEKAGLKKGESIFVEHDNNGGIIVSSQFKKSNEEKAIEIDLSGKDEASLWREISAAYAKGYNKMKFKNKKNKESLSLVKKALGGLLSLEVVENNEDNVVVKDFFNMEDINRESFVKRIDNNLKEIFETIIESLAKKNTSSIKLAEIEETDNDINRFYMLIFRILYLGVDNPSVLSMLKTDGISLINNWWFAFNLERVGDNLKSIAKILKNNKLKGKEIEQVHSLLSSIKNLHEKSLEVFYKKDSSTATRLSIEGKEIWEECEKMSESDNSQLAKIALKLKDIELTVYQSLKMVIYLVD